MMLGELCAWVCVCGGWRAFTRCVFPPSLRLGQSHRRSCSRVQRRGVYVYTF
jgi:hypothetical protein